MRTIPSSEGMFECKSKQCVREDEVCNGKRDCSDGSDEMRHVCFNHYCPSYDFRCGYGACVPRKSSCNRILDCLDGSDETEELCGWTPPVNTHVTSPTKNHVANSVNSAVIKTNVTEIDRARVCP